MSRWKRAGPTVGFTLVSLAVVALSPAVLLAGEPVNRHFLHGMRARPVKMMRHRTRLPWPGSETVVTRRYYRHTGPGWVYAGDACQGRRFGALAEPFLENPVWITLTAPARWLADHVPPLGRRGNGTGPPPAGVREPRRPRPDRPAGAMALPEPR